MVFKEWQIHGSLNQIFQNEQVTVDGPANKDSTCLRFLATVFIVYDDVMFNCISDLLIYL